MWKFLASFVFVELLNGISWREAKAPCININGANSRLRKKVQFFFLASARIINFQYKQSRVEAKGTTKRGRDRVNKIHCRNTFEQRTGIRASEKENKLCPRLERCKKKRADPRHRILSENQKAKWWLEWGCENPDNDKTIHREMCFASFGSFFSHFAPING
jgi:hypothetical protein